MRCGTGKISRSKVVQGHTHTDFGISRRQHTGSFQVNGPFFRRTDNARQFAQPQMHTRL